MSKRYAVIDIGTRGVRLLIADASPQGIDRVVCSTGEIGELGRGMKSTGRLSAESIEKVKEIVSGYVEICKQHQVNELVATGTEVIRAAKNRDVFLKKLAPVVEVQVLKPQEEALFSFLAATDAFDDSLRLGDTALVVDQGGGSVELSCGSIEEGNAFVLQGFDSLRVGTVALTKLLTKAKTLKDGYHQVMDSVRTAVENHQKFNALKEKEPTTVFGLGSAITDLAKQCIGGGKRKGIALKGMHGLFISKKDIEMVVLRTLDILAKSNFKNSELAVDSNYATMFCGILTYHYVLRKYGGKGVVVNRHGLSYGVLLWSAGKNAQIDLT